MGNQEGFSQEINTEKVEKKSIDEKATDSSNSNTIIFGNVADQIGPLPGTAIHNVRTRVETSTDIDGNFSIDAEIGDEILITYVGYESQTLKIQSSEKLLVKMKGDEFDEVIVVGMIALEERRNFFGRIFRSIGNIFR